MSYIKFIISAALAASLAACASAGNENLRNVTSASLAGKLTNDKTTKADVRALLGDPDTLNFSDSGNEIWKYQHVKAQVKAANFIPVVDLLAGGRDVKKKELALFFNNKGVLKNYSMLETESEIRTGLITANM